MIKKLKMCAEFLGYTVSCGSLWEDGYRQMELEDFNPHEETGRHWQVEIMRKFNLCQFKKWWELMTEEAPQIGWRQWIMTAPAEISFKCIVEVLESE